MTIDERFDIGLAAAALVVAPAVVVVAPAVVVALPPPHAAMKAATAPIPPILMKRLRLTPTVSAAARTASVLRFVVTMIILLQRLTSNQAEH
jgi:hypothetical protein